MISFQDFPLANSLRMNLRHMSTGRPVLLLTCEIHSRALRRIHGFPFPSASSIQRHFLNWASWLIYFTLAFSHRSSFRILFDQKIRKILRRHLFMKTCMSFGAAFRVSHPLSNTGRTFDLKKIKKFKL